MCNILGRGKAVSLFVMYTWFIWYVDYVYLCMHSGEFKIDHECVQNTKIKLVHLYSNTLRMTVHIKGVMAVYAMYKYM